MPEQKKDGKIITTTTQKSIQREYEDFMTSHWRPIVAYSYVAIILFDFIFGAILFTAFAAMTGNPLVVWESLTLGQGGMFHLAIGAILGLASWTRGQEKVERARRGYRQDMDSINEKPPEGFGGN